MSVTLAVTVTQVGAVAQRSVRRTLRQPAAIVFPLLFPILLLLVNSGGLKASTALPGFPTDSFLAFALAVPFLQGALFATMNAGTDLARDIQTGFLNRLALTPIRGSALLAGTLTGIVILGVAQAVAAFAISASLFCDRRPGAADRVRRRPERDLAGRCGARPVRRGDVAGPGQTPGFRAARARVRPARR
jgi:ABC-2 type transport system permease protein